jgi:NTE family protein
MASPVLCQIACDNRNVAEARSALVLSAGGMFGAYQAGAWQALEEFLRPDIVVGASVGCLNGWAIAGGCSGDWLASEWCNERRGQRLRWRFPRSITDGCLDSRDLEDDIRRLYAGFQPVRQFGVVLTALPAMRAHLFQAGDVTWEHLAASCAVPGLLPQRRIAGSLWSDGGLLGALPLWASVEMGATRIVAVNALPVAPSRVASFLLGGLRTIAHASRNPPGVPCLTIAPDPPLGSPSDMLVWRRGKVEEWIERGRRDAAAKRHLIL